jgi:hypothetical protein
MKNWVVAAVAIAMGVGVSSGLLVLTNPERSQLEVYALARDVSQGQVIDSDALRLEPVVLDSGHASLFTRDDAALLSGVRAAHDLAAGQLLQRGDVAATGVVSDERLVLLPVKDAPPTAPGQRVDLFVVSGTADNPSVVPFALGVEVRAVVTGGLVVGVPAKQATAYAYAAEVMRLIAVVAAADAAPVSEPPIATPDQAMAAVGEP